MLLLADTVQEEMRKYCAVNGFDLTYNFDGGRITPEEFEFHCTLVFSEDQPHNYRVRTGTTKLNAFSLKPNYVGTIGQEKLYPCLHLERTSDLVGLRNQFVAFHGLKPTFPEFKAHVTLSYAPTLPDDVTRLKVPDFPLVVDRVKVSDPDHVNTPKKLPGFKEWTKRNAISFNL